MSGIATLVMSRRRATTRRRRGGLAPAAKTSTGVTALLGTDALGRDVLAQIVYGARTSVFIGVVTVAVCTVIGLLIGFVAGYYRGWVDSVLARLIDILQAFPGIL